MISEPARAPAGNAPTFLANSVANGAIIVPDKRNSGNSNVPKVIIRIKRPRVTTSKAGVTPIAIIPASGRIPLPTLESKIASTSIIGARMLAHAQISARPAINGQSKPILKRRPCILPLAKLVIP